MVSLSGIDLDEGLILSVVTPRLMFDLLIGDEV